MHLLSQRRRRAEGQAGCVDYFLEVPLALSGGLDSSSVACVAQSLINTGTISKNGFETFSMVFPGWPCDESDYIHDVGQKWKKICIRRLLSAYTAS